MPGVALGGRDLGSVETRRGHGGGTWREGVYARITVGLFTAVRNWSGARVRLLGLEDSGAWASSSGNHR